LGSTVLAGIWSISVVVAAVGLALAVSTVATIIVGSASSIAITSIVIIVGSASYVAATSIIGSLASLQAMPPSEGSPLVL